MIANTEKSFAEIDEQVREFNRKYPVGTRVTYRSYPESSGFEAVVKGRAFISYGGYPVVTLSDGLDWVLLDAVR